MPQDKNARLFLEEAAELLTDLESALLELEGNPGDAELIARIFRDMHTIKGSGAMFGFEEMAAFAHHVESALDRLREGAIKADGELIDIVLAAKDYISGLLGLGGPARDESEAQRIIAALKKLVPAPCTPEKKPAEKIPRNGPARFFHIRFRPDREIFSRGIDPASILRELKGLGECQITCHTEEVPPLSDIDPEKCYLYWDILIRTQQALEALRDVFIFVEEDSDIVYREIEEPGPDEARKPIGEILLERKDIDA
ncbi:MAG: Hpt domain-containing protein, partial [Nitrospirota bacterium]